MSWLDTYLNDYIKWLKTNTTIVDDSDTGWSVVSTPFLGAFNDAIDIYMKQQDNGNILMSDNGDTIENLELQGVDFSKSKKRKDIRNSILLNYGIKINKHDELFVEASANKFSQSKHNLLQTIIEINDMYTLASHNIKSLFIENVRSYFENLDVIYTPNFITKGETGLEFTFDFQVAKRNKELVIKSFNRINKSNLSSFLFSWEDIKPLRQKVSKKDVEAIAIINDVDNDVKDEYIEAIQSKNAKYILWSEKDNSSNQELLVA